MGGIEGAEIEFSQEYAENKKNETGKMSKNPIATPDNSYNGRSRLGDPARMRHISHHPKSCSVLKPKTTYFWFPQKRNVSILTSG